MGIELGPEGFGRGRKKERLHRVGKGVNKVGGGDNDSTETQGWKTDWFFSRQWKKPANENYFVARTFQRPSPWIWPSFSISPATSLGQALFVLFPDSS